jgi:DNA topoisomerase-1
LQKAQRTITDTLLADGIRRIRRRGGGFSYRDRAGHAVSKETRHRIETLRIPPAWTHVAIHPSARGRVQAIGRDAAGRWQYRYHAWHVAQRTRTKFGRLASFIEALPGVRRKVARELARDDLSRERVMSGILRILLTCFLRPGSSVYASENGSFGIATLRRKHVSVTGTRVNFDFPGKSKKRQTRSIRDPALARLISELIQLPGHEVFKFRRDTGELVDVRRRHINRFIAEVMGHGFSAKDFRTWAGTLLCACFLAKTAKASPFSDVNRKRAISAAIRETAAHLGNTPAVCRSSYVAPSLLASYERGRVVDEWPDDVTRVSRVRSRALERCERSLLSLLSQPAPRAITARAGDRGGRSATGR